MRPIGILTKIWLSLSILIVGYFISMALGFVSGRQTESRLYNVSEGLFPAATQSRESLTVFDQQIKLYKDAVVFGEESFLELALVKSKEVQKSLLIVSKIKGLDQGIINDVNECVKKLKDFTKEAQNVYKITEISQKDTEEGKDGEENIFESKAVILAEQRKQLRRKLTYFAEKFANELKTELSAISNITKQQRYLNMVVFFIVVVSALILVSIIVSRTISRPLRKILMLEKAVEQSVDGIAVADMKGDLQFINHAWATMHGYEISELTGKQVELFHTEDQFKNEIIPFNQRVMKNGSHAGEVWHKRKDGTAFPVLRAGNLLTGHDKKTVSMVCLARDITERKKAEGNILKANQQLELESERANKMAEKAEIANIAKSEFLANMSHEIRTPMNGVIGMTGLLLDTDLTDEQCEFAETVKASADSLLQLINDILDFSKIEAGKLDIEEIDFNIRSMMDDFAATMAFRTEEKGLEFICSPEPDVPSFVKGDPGRLRQILTNLTGNAVKFTQKGEVAVLCHLEEELQNSRRFCFSIRDTGIGIPKDKQSVLFEKFTQADSSTTREFGGTGLGLAISKQLSELMGGEIGIESEEGKGSTFWFTVELKNSDKKPEPSEIGDLSKANVLFIDDNKTNREVVGAMLSSWNIEHTLSESGIDGLDMLYGAYDKGNPFDIAILDMQMPKMDGAAVGKAIKSDEKLKETHLVLLTSLSNRGDAARFKREGFAAFLTKPIRQSDLYDCLTQVMGIAAYGDSAKERPLITRHSISENRRAKARLLLVEDNSTNRTVAKAILKKLGYSADVAVDGLEALKALKEAPYDLVFMDIQMPVMGGVEATREIRNTESDVLNHKIPIIALTANAMKGDREKCINAGMDDYIAKPIIKEKVRKMLEKWLPKDEGLRTDSSENTESTENTGDNSTDNSADNSEELLLFLI